MNKLIKSAIAGVFLGSILATTACGDWRSNDEINAENAIMSLEVCQDGEVLHLLEPQTDTRDGVKTVTLPPNGVSDVGDFWLTDGQSWSPDRTPKATEEDPNPKTEFGTSIRRMSSFVTFSNGTRLSLGCTSSRRMVQGKNSPRLSSRDRKAH